MIASKQISLDKSRYVHELVMTYRYEVDYTYFSNIKLLVYYPKLVDVKEQPNSASITQGLKEDWEDTGMMETPTEEIERTKHDDERKEEGDSRQER